MRGVFNSLIFQPFSISIGCRFNEKLDCGDKKIDDILPFFSNFLRSLQFIV